MDFLDPQKRRAHNIRLMVGYFLIGLALLLAATLLLFIALGYGINRSTGEVTQNGLLFVDAHPEQARIKINGQDRGSTDGRFVMEAGTYDIELSRDKYRTWQKQFVLEGGNIVRLVYPFLFPVDLINSDTFAYTAAPDMVTSSPDRKWIVSHVPDAVATLQITNTSTKERETTAITLPAALLGSRSGQRFEAEEWSTDNRHLLVKYSYQGGYDYLIIDREKPAESLNLTQVFGKAYTKVTLRDKAANQVYLYDASGGTLLSGQTGSRATEAVATGVISFWPYKNNEMLYTTNTGAADGKTLVKLKDGATTYTVREIVRSEVFLLNMAEFDGDVYVVCGSTADGKVYVYKNPVPVLKDSSKKELVHHLLMKLDKPEYLTFSANARFIAIQAGSNFEVYDIETKNQYKYDVKLLLTAGQKATWMDGHRLMLVSSDNVMNVFDFDGTNKQALVTTNQAFVPAFDRDYNQLFTVGPLQADKARTGLIRTDLNLGTE